MYAEHDGPAYGPPRELPGFELHYQNMESLRGSDVLVTSIGGAGSSLVGNILLELDFRYINLATEVLLPTGASEFAPSIIRQRLHGEALAARATTGHREDGPRFLKSHLPAEEFDGLELGRVWLVVRDPRDALYSWHQFHRGFARHKWEHVPESFEQFLARPFFTGLTPVENWCAFYRGWLARYQGGQRLSVVRFEDLKRSPTATITSVLTDTGVHVATEDVVLAVERSSFDAMRANEAAATRHDPNEREARIMRSGSVDGWKTWMTPRIARHFASREVIDVAKSFGYDLSQ